MSKELQSLNWIRNNPQQNILQIPLHFSFEPVQIISKQLTKLKCTLPYRIYYLGPRWNNSTLFHKMFSQKHGYQFDIMKINRNNNFFSETMSNNQYYRNQFYYRAFEGMNPTLIEPEIIFDSKFESGNLDCAIKVGHNEYDLFLRIDSNTRGHMFWYYFSVGNVKAGETIKFNICNFTKHKTLYSSSLKPFVCVQNDQIKENCKDWSADGADNVTFEAKKLRYQFIYQKVKVRKLHQLSFTYTFHAQTDKVFFAYCIPYGYSTLLQQLDTLPSNIAQIGILGKSLTGVDIPVVKIGKSNEQKSKPVVFITGRFHPSETNGSIKLSGFMKYLCSAPQAQILRNNVIFVIIPMVNPDGVIFGNSRTGASGKDLNRQFRSKNIYLFPEVYMIKQLLLRIQNTHEIQLCLDFHGHSLRKNMFFFGPQFNITQMQYYKARIIPKILASIAPIFRYYSCSYNLPESKKNTARGVMINQFKIPYVFTIESSIGLFYDYVTRKDSYFSYKIWQQLGQSIGSAIKQFFEHQIELEKFLEARRNQKLKSTKNKPQKQQKKNQNEPEIKIFKLFNQIKKMQEVTPKKQHNADSDADSDSQDQQDNLQVQKMNQFQGMVIAYADSLPVLSKMQQINEDFESKQINFKKKNTMRNNLLMNDLWKQKNREKQTKSIQKEYRDFKQQRSPEKNLPIIQSSMRYNLDEETAKPLEVSEKVFRKLDPISQKKQIKNLNCNNITVFNFSSMIESSQFQRNQKEENKKYQTLQNRIKKTGLSIQLPKPDLDQTKGNKLNILALSPQEVLFEDKQQDMLKKTKNVYPVSFYRIKYFQVSTKRNMKKKVQDSKKDHEFNICPTSQSKSRSYSLQIKKIGK